MVGEGRRVNTVVNGVVGGSVVVVTVVEVTVVSETSVSSGVDFLGFRTTNSLGGSSTSAKRSPDTQHRSPALHNWLTSKAASQYSLIRLATHTPGQTRKLLEGA